jgi:hypothetical protein
MIVNFRKAVRTIYLKKEGSSMDKLVFENLLLKYIVCFDIRCIGKQENIGTAFC